MKRDIHVDHLPNIVISCNKHGHRFHENCYKTVDSDQYVIYEQSDADLQFASKFIAGSEYICFVG